MKKKIRFEYFLQAAILFGFALYFTGTIVTGTVYRYVHERHVPMLLLSAAALMLLGIVKWRQAVTAVSGRMIFQSASASRQTADETRPQVHTFRRILFALTRYRNLLGPAVFAAALIGMLAAAGTNLRFSQFAYSDSLGESSAVSAAPITVPHPLLVQDGRIIMDDVHFSAWMSELYTKLDLWVGTKITASGSVWKDGDMFASDEFALARMMMVCCAADLQPVGILAKWDEHQTLTDGEWVEITGTIAKTPYKDRFDPLIIVESVKKITPPQQEYVYQ
jgi:TIGR03943 family protein